RPLATLGRKPRQGRKAATVSIDAGAEASWRGHHPFLSLSCARKAGALLSWPVATGSSSWRRTVWSGAVSIDAGAEASWLGHYPFGNRTSRERPGDSFSRPHRHGVAPRPTGRDCPAPGALSVRPTPVPPAADRLPG